MKYDLTLKNKNNDIIELVYDTSISTLKYKDGKDVDLSNITTPTSKKTIIKRYTVQLGFSCNMSCSYCLQSKTKKSSFDKDKCDKVIEDILKETGFLKIEFWGGEPLLYWEEIKYIVDNLPEKKYNFLIITNGTLLTIDKVQYLMDKNFSLGISHDAQSQDIRGKDPLDNPVSLEAIRYLAINFPYRFSFNTVLTKKNFNTKNVKQFFRDKLNLPLENINIGGEGIVYNTELDLVDLVGVKNSIVSDIMLGEGKDYHPHINKIYNFINSIKNSNKLENITTKCGIEKTETYQISNLHGKELTCHNFDYKFKINRFTDNDKCKECLVAHLCKGGCPAIDKDSDIFKKNCEVFYQVNLGYLIVSLEYIFKGYVMKSYQVLT